MKIFIDADGCPVGMCASILVRSKALEIQRDRKN